jgi:hypothetical protein
MKTIMFAAVMASIGISVIAGDANLVSSSDLKEWKGAKVVDGGKVLEATNHKFIQSKMFPINPQNSYVLSAMFKSGNDKNNTVYLGMKFFDAKKRSIKSISVNPVNKSETELTADVNKGAKVIFLKDASKLIKYAKLKRLQIGFDSDKGLPNRKLSPIVTSLGKKDGVWEATLQKPLPFAATKGTKVQGHIASSSYMYVAISKKKNLKEWINFSGAIRPEIKTGALGKAIWPGTKYGCVIILANWGQKDGEVLQMKDISLTAQ